MGRCPGWTMKIKRLETPASFIVLPGSRASLYPRKCVLLPHSSIHSRYATRSNELITRWHVARILSIVVGLVVEMQLLPTCWLTPSNRYIVKGTAVVDFVRSSVINVYTRCRIIYMDVYFVIIIGDLCKFTRRYRSLSFTRAREKRENFIPHPGYTNHLSVHLR